MKFFKENKLFWMILAFLISIRLINITMPILEGTAMRQAQTAMIARNFFRYGFNLFYPRADFFGGGPGYLVLEFPLLNCLAAIGYMALGGVYEWIGRLISILFFAGASLFLYLLTKRIFSKETAIWAVLIFGLSPLSIIFSRAFMPDFEMIFFCLGALYFLFSFSKSNGYKEFWISAIFMSFALLVKPHSFYMIIPLTYILWRLEGLKCLINYKNWLYAIIALLPALLWYFHGVRVHTIYTPEWLYNYQASNWFDIRDFFNIKLYFRLLELYGGIVFTPIGLTLLICGFLIKTKGDENIIWFWFCGTILFLIAFVTHLKDPYYHINVLPVCSIFIARAICFLKVLNWRKTVLNRTWGKVVLILMILPFWLRYSAYAYVVPKGYQYVVEAGQRIQELTNRDDLVIASTAGGAQGLYFCDRKGWEFLLSDITHIQEKEAIEKLENLRNKGAKFFVSSNMNDFNRVALFKRYIEKNYKLVEKQAGKYVIFSLNQKNR